MNNLYAELKSYVNDLPVNDNILKKTKEEYINECKRMFANGTVPETQAKRKSSFYKYRAAWIYSNTQLAYIKIEEIDKEQDNNIRDKLIITLNNIVDSIKKYSSDAVPVIFKNSTVDPKLSKKGQIIKLDNLWSFKMFSHMLAVESIYLDAVCVSMLSGARPVEIQSGILVKKTDDGLTFVIAGSKNHGDKYGQQERKFTLKINDLHFEYLYNKIDGEILIKIDSAKLFGEQIRRNSKIIFPHMQPYISPYTYRHNFSRLLKNAGLSHDDIARCLGHCTDKSQKYYSHASNKDNTGFEISNISATKKIKKVINNDYIKTALNNHQLKL